MTHHDRPRFRAALTVLMSLILSGHAAIPLLGQDGTPIQGTNSPTAAYVVALLSKADTAWEHDRCDDAADLYRQAFLVDPSIKRAAYRMGWCYNQQARFSEALWALKDAVQLDPADDSIRARAGLQSGEVDAGILLNLGASLNAVGRYPEAIEPLQRAILLNPDHSVTHRELGFAYEALGQADEALTAYQRAIRLDPKAADAHYRLGLLLSRRGDKAFAAVEVEILKTLDPEKGEDLLARIR